jgi:hypothetical protein
MADAEGAAERLELILALNKFSDRIDSLSKHTTHQTVSLSGGSMGLWIAVTACLVMLATLAVAIPIGVGAYLATQSDIRQLQNTDNAIRAYINTGKMPPAPPAK